MRKAPRSVIVGLARDLGDEEAADAEESGYGLTTCVWEQRAPAMKSNNRCRKNETDNAEVIEDGGVARVWR